MKYSACLSLAFALTSSQVSRGVCTKEHPEELSYGHWCGDAQTAEEPRVEKMVKAAEVQNRE